MNRAATDPAMLAALAHAGLLEAGEQPVFEALTGGVSSDIWKVTTRAGTVCVKRALARLKVAADWQAPVERNAFEVGWYEVAHGIEPMAAPRVLHHEPESGLFVMQYLDPAEHRLWKSELRDGRAEFSNLRFSRPMRLVAVRTEGPKLAKGEPLEHLLTSG